MVAGKWNRIPPTSSSCPQISCYTRTIWTRVSFLAGSISSVFRSPRNSKIVTSCFISVAVWFSQFVRSSRNTDVLHICNRRRASLAPDHLNALFFIILELIVWHAVSAVSTCFRRVSLIRIKQCMLDTWKLETVDLQLSRCCTCWCMNGSLLLDSESILCLILKCATCVSLKNE